MGTAGICQTYCSWNGQEPNNYQNTDECVLQMVASGLWNDQGISVTSSFIVEYNGMIRREKMN